MITKEFKVFFGQIMLLTIALAVISLAAFNFVPDTYKSQTWPFVLLFFVLTNSILYFFYLRIHSRKVSSFANFFMITTSAKLIFYLIVIVVYLYFNRDEAVPFLLSFFLYYLVYTFFEVKSIMKLQRAGNQ
jgi:amino acid transporter